MMNATEKTTILKANGYEVTKTTTGDTVWWFEGMAIAEHESKAKSTSIAYEHLYETNDDFVNPFAQKKQEEYEAYKREKALRNQSSTEAPESEAVASELPVQEYSVAERNGLYYVVSPDLRVLTTGYADTKVLGIIAALLSKETTPIAQENHSLHTQLQSALIANEDLKRQLEIAQARIETDAAYMTGLEAKNEALTGKLEYLHKKVKSHYAEAKSKATKASMGGDADKERYYAGIEDEMGIILGAFANVQEQALKAPVQDAPKFYSVTERIETTYKTNDFTGKRYPSDYSIFTVVSPDGLNVESYSALEHGLDNAEYCANALRDKLNKAVKS